MEKRVKEELNLLTKIIINTIPVGRIFLFGSYADGKPKKDSDLDIFIVMSDSAKIKEIDAIRLVRKAIRDKKTFPVDIIISKESKFNRRKALNTIEHHINKDGIIIYG